jgi:hypothetical protein
MASPNSWILQAPDYTMDMGFAVNGGLINAKARYCFGPCSNCGSYHFEDGPMLDTDGSLWYTCYNRSPAVCIRVPTVLNPASEDMLAVLAIAGAGYPGTSWTGFATDPTLDFARTGQQDLILGWTGYPELVYSWGNPIQILNPVVE